MTTTTTTALDWAILRALAGNPRPFPGSMLYEAAGLPLGIRAVPFERALYRLRDAGLIDCRDNLLTLTATGRLVAASE